MIYLIILDPINGFISIPFQYFFRMIYSHLFDPILELIDNQILSYNHIVDYAQLLRIIQVINILSGNGILHFGVNLLLTMPLADLPSHVYYVVDPRRKGIHFREKDFEAILILSFQQQRFSTSFYRGGKWLN